VTGASGPYRRQLAGVTGATGPVSAGYPTGVTGVTGATGPMGPQGPSYDLHKSWKVEDPESDVSLMHTPFTGQTTLRVRSKWGYREVATWDGSQFRFPNQMEGVDDPYHRMCGALCRTIALDALPSRAEADAAVSPAFERSKDCPLWEEIVEEIKLVHECATVMMT